MQNVIKCTNCGAEIEISQALAHEIEERVMEQAKKAAAAEFSPQIDLEKERNRKLIGQIEELLTQIRKLRQKDEEREMEMKRKILQEEEKIKQEAMKKAEEEHRLKDLEKESKLQEALRQIEELKSKIQRGSQQVQGEVLEWEIESLLKREFSIDEIEEIKKGQRGADISQTVVDKLGRKCGIILWETKNAQWSETWIAKLKEDQRQAKADLAVLVTVNMPQDKEGFFFS